jgi:uncharacterized protein YndB with AHSA1/START domain
VTDIQRIELSTILHAPPAEVFRAWTDPTLLAEWFAPAPMIVAEAQADPVAGGRWRIAMRGEGDGPVVSGAYTEVMPGERLATSWAWEGDVAPPTTVRVEFRAVRAGTDLHLVHQGFATREAHDQHLHGWVGCLAKLAALYQDDSGGLSEFVA